MRYEELTIEGRNAVLEAFRAGKTIDKLFVQDGCKDGPVQSIVREARKQTPSLTLCRESAWTRCPRPESIRVLLPTRQLTSTQRWRHVKGSGREWRATVHFPVGRH